MTAFGGWAHRPTRRSASTFDSIFDAGSRSRRVRVRQRGVGSGVPQRGDRRARRVQRERLGRRHEFLAARWQGQAPRLPGEEVPCDLLQGSTWKSPLVSLTDWVAGRDQTKLC